MYLCTYKYSLYSAAVAQDVNITMMSGDQCFGSRVTLLCTHPDPFADSGRYIQEGIRWAENGTTIDFTDPSSAKFTVIRVSSNISTLSFNVTEEDHGDRVITCTCFLVLNNANRDREESKDIIMDAPGEYMNLLLLFQVLFIHSFTHAWTLHVVKTVLSS